MTGPEFTRGIELTPDRPVDEVADLGARAEAEGFEAVFASSHYNNRDPYVALSRVAARTDDVALGPGVVNPYDVHPVKLAGQVATLAEASEGRAHLGVGAGDRSTLSNLGVDRDRPLRRVLETLRVARRLWDGERVDHDGTFRADEAGLNFEPPGEVPVYVGAQGPDMLRMAGKHADGVLVNGTHPRDLSWAADRVAEGAAERPGDADAVQTLVFASVSVADDADRARTAARRPVAFIVAGAPEPVLDRHDLDHECASEVGAAIEAGEFGRADDLVTPAMLDAFAAAGDVDAVAARLSALLDHADGVVVAAPLGPDPERAIELAAAALARATR
jgi:5,10-methylenetetrahydromethanopterin reductase